MPWEIRFSISTIKSPPTWLKVGVAQEIRAPVLNVQPTLTVRLVGATFRVSVPLRIVSMATNA